ncbi:MAG: hypothetical protein COZ75_09985 [Flavobacteriaceae bacterium CG_4_8_14_3_um_filter_34_10]|nr:hypothetical protein [Flavobacteriia bacterium]OIP52411.1 MAG: hypothetical protein AUK33_01030 [Flavobacteriaceae bacterium CG2_30_34_30]PIQ17297.1 MAG: hypothetical protein COW66_12575 [Flavobacteriaceae bacterium CG18_big_fil_WC_8_21_14_2_50_34_36]PIV49633.1 MAG: hypothetical protein COS19_07640 [Flavobacteriaceae bacterium CG02_land_8_20_14_3_00_34_13]PIX08824.1 MAG: hypothetical protein COZ75_09985 [Flavobacteriaceae bacterium CG_4_8_14_3_um_filter_34_10]PIZ07634.1 MAG: hypothetical pr
MIFSQEDAEATEEPEVKLERAAFESTALIESQTNVLNTKGTLEMTMNHRFDLVDTDNSLIGLYGAANIRIALSYAIHDRITVGFGTTKDNRLQDFNLKGAILRQTRGNEMPISVSYYGNFTIDARQKNQGFFYNTEDRYSFFNQLIISKRFTRNISFMVAPSVSHYNVVENTMKNDMFAIAFGGRAKISPQTSIIAEYNQPITTFDVGTPEPGVSLGVEFSTGSHAFQVFVTNYKGIVAQKNNMFNQNNFFDGDFMIGFNITRLWHL